MKDIRRLLAAVLLAGLLAGCAGPGAEASRPAFGPAADSAGAAGQSASQKQEGSWETITQQQAKELLDSQEDFVLLDVRTQLEYDEGHIPGATLLPDYQVAEKAEELLPDKDQLILVYCRSGSRSKSASRALAKLGYTRVKNFGGIRDWPYEITAD